ncbi:V/A-type H+-transporting ATPase subunit D [Acetoanaerobium noterae]|jgi:V/A-type H+-transporting ATPase subunit D|uniref:V-type ATP synthase subunit D n=2 Tax=Acetoanaerobium TaxID=186831 RepID=E3PUJ3_ACESD|nr:MULTISPECIES: V-type ATP synthase subunit D [Acetoanaerobium]MDK2804018.1 V/A-type H+/Na+-transporting ATPase subunit [Peptostreptococcaceae bacterium]CBH22431.1 V-type sodium ATP synthase subunit D [Acetoanaerobium sticklandii]SKB67421.1 V/A-type H+-transporting ATPase subunit D [Acetoanaerobium noterae]
MSQEFTPTKANLLKSKDALDFSKKGFSLLDKKRTVLIREVMGLVEKANEIQKLVEEKFEEGYRALQVVNMTIGINNVQEIALSIPKDETFEILYRSIMGLEVPTVEYEKKEDHPTYSFYRTNPAMDIAAKKFLEIKYLIYELAEIENAVYKIAMEIKKTGKRANALDKIQIPRYEEAVKYIQDVLEEKEREDFFRLKKVKDRF